jgi:multidrug resistance protein, MATE family
MRRDARPALLIDADGNERVDWRGIVAIALPLLVNSSLQAALNLTDTWFIGRLSAQAVAAVGGVYWVVLGLMLLLGGVGFAVQAFAAQAFGSGRRVRAAQATWSGLWASLLLVPAFIGLWLGGPVIVPAIGLPPDIAALSVEYWGPRMLGGPLGVALWASLSFFMGIGHVRVALAINAAVVVSNAILNEVLIFGAGLGIAGAAWATTLSVSIGLALALATLLSGRYRRGYGTHFVWKPRWRSVAAVLRVGVPLGIAVAVDLLGMAAFQAMLTRLGVVPGAATQIVAMLTSIAYMPAVGLGMAGTTLVGQSIGAGDREWAYRVGMRVVLLSMGYMCIVGIAVAAAGPWLAPLFVSAADPAAADVVALAITLLWIAAAYQLFDGLNIGAGFCLRGAGDTRFPALMLLVLAGGFWVPLTHTLAFHPGEGWIAGAPGLGLGAVGGWWAAVAYVVVLGLAMLLRWRSKRWQRIRLG